MTPPLPRALEIFVAIGLLWLLYWHVMDVIFHSRRFKGRWWLLGTRLLFWTTLSVCLGATVYLLLAGGSWDVWAVVTCVVTLQSFGLFDQLPRWDP